MRSALITGRLEGELAPSTVVAPPSAPREVTEKFKALIAAGGGGFAEVQLWLSSGGICKKKRFSIDEQTTAKLEAELAAKLKLEKSTADSNSKSAKSTK